MRVAWHLAMGTNCEPMGTGARHMWRFQKRAYGVVLVFKCEGCDLTTARHSKRFWGRVY